MNIFKKIRLFFYNSLCSFGFFGKDIVSEYLIKGYADLYISVYKNLAKKIKFEEYRNHLFLQRNRYYQLHCIISQKRGALIEFIPADGKSITCESVSQDIIKYFFYSNSTKKPRNTKLRFKNTIKSSPHLKRPLFTIDSKRVTMSKLAFKTNKQNVISLSKNGDVTFREIDVNGYLNENQIFLKGSNKVKDWTMKNAYWDAQFRFANDLRFAFHESKEFRKYIATPHLSKIAKDIISKEKNGKYSDSYGVLEYETDLKKLRQLANEMEVETNHVDTVLQFVRTKAGRPNWLQRNPIFVRVIGGLIIYVLTQIFNWKWIVNQFYKVLDYLGF